MEAARHPLSPGPAAPATPIAVPQRPARARERAEQGGAYIVITHNIAAARRVGAYLAVLCNGRLVQSGEASDMFASEDPFVRQLLAGAPAGPLGMN